MAVVACKVVVVGALTPPPMVEVAVAAVVAGGDTGREGAAAQETFRPLVKEVRPADPSTSRVPSGTVPT